MRLSHKILFVCMLLCGFVPALAFANTTVPMNASALNTSSAFNKFLYSFPIPATSTFVGLTGSASIHSDTNVFSEALISVKYIPAGSACPQAGEEYSSYDAIFAKYPTMRTLAQYILKEPAAGTSTMPTQLTLPASVAVSGCAVVILDGSILGSGGNFTMTSNMSAVFSSLPTLSPAPSLVGAGD